jgi:hypothetical protein
MATAWGAAAHGSHLRPAGLGACGRRFLVITGYYYGWWAVAAISQPVQLQLRRTHWPRLAATSTCIATRHQLHLIAHVVFAIQL